MMKKLLAALLCCFLLTACGQTQTPDPTEDPTGPAMVTDPTEDTQEITNPEEDTDPVEDPTVDGKPRFLVYTMDENLEHFVETWVEAEELTPETILAALTEAGAITADVTVNSLTQEGTTLTVDFGSGLADLVNTMGTAGERAVLGSIVNTFLGAYAAEEMYITVDGQILESGHVIYDMAMGFME